jgi:hypothetical protein
MEYWYNQQLRQYRLQIIRAFSNFYVSMGFNDDGTPKLRRVPCRWGDASRLAETISNSNSENKLPTAPFISVYMTGMSLAPNRRTAPSLVSTQNVIEREYDGEQARYLGTQGNRSTVQRYMPVPFDITFNVDFWTSNLQQKEELIEQTQVLYNGMVDIQTSNNPLDWTAITYLEPTNITWSSRSIPIGTENPIDVCTVEYKIPIHINPPAKVQMQRIIQQVVTNIRDGDVEDGGEWTEGNVLTRNITTPLNAWIHMSVAGESLYEISLQSLGGDTRDPQGLPTRVQGTPNPSLAPGTSFRFNGYQITIPNTSIDDLVALIRAQTQDTNLNAVFTLSRQLEFWNMSGEDIVLENVVGNAVESLGFTPTTYRGGTLSWWRLLDNYGSLRDYRSCDTSASQLRLLSSEVLDERDNDIVGYIQLHPTNQNLLQWIPDFTTFPAPQLSPITAVIDPQKTFPGAGLSEPKFAQRYLLINPIAAQSAAWGQVAAGPNDIIEWNGAQWITSFNSSQQSNTTYVLNQYSYKYYKWSDGEWSIWPTTPLGPGSWRLAL